MADRAVKLQPKSTSHDLAEVTQRLANSKIQDLTPIHDTDDDGGWDLLKPTFIGRAVKQ